MWLKVVVACIPGAVITLLFDDYIEAHLHTPLVIALALIIYGIAFIVIEKWNKTRVPTTKTLDDISYKTAFLIGLFQILSIIPGTSRSGSTIVGALLIGVSRVAAAEFTFFDNGDGDIVMLRRRDRVARTGSDDDQVIVRHYCP